MSDGAGTRRSCAVASQSRLGDVVQYRHDGRPDEKNVHADLFRLDIQSSRSRSDTDKYFSHNKQFCAHTISCLYAWDKHAFCLRT